jgi:chemotaxis protein CheX
MPFSADFLRRLQTQGPVLEKALIQDVKNVFRTLVGMDHLLHLPLSVDPASNFNDCISALVGLAGSYNGLVSLHVSTHLARTITAQLHEVADPSEEEIEDALGEIANVLAGSFKRHLSQNSLDIKLSTPWVVTGKQYVIHVTKKSEVTALLFDSDEDWFMVALAIEND